MSLLQGLRDLLSLDKSATPAMLLQYRLAEHFESLDPLGSSSMSDVYRGRRVGTGEDVVVKLLSEQFSSDAGWLARFRHEGEYTHASAHPNVVRILDGGWTYGRPYHVFEYLPGSTLDEALREGGAMRPSRAAAIVADLLAGLGAVHAAGIVHRDVKPENVVLAGARNVRRAVLIDFGLAHSVEPFDGDPTSASERVGTPIYMSPEQARGEPSGALGDVWSAGVVLYQLLCGRRPVLGKSVSRVLDTVGFEPPPRIETFAPDVPHALAEIVHRALAFEPAQRYQSAHAFRADLLRWIEENTP